MKLPMYTATIIIISMLLLFPAGVYAVTDHSGHGGGSAGTAEKQSNSGVQPGQGASGAHGPDHTTINSAGSGMSVTDMHGQQLEDMTGDHDSQGTGTGGGQEAAGGRESSPGGHSEKASSGGHESSGGHDEKASSGGPESTGGHGDEDKAGDHGSSGEHGGEQKTNVLEPFKNEIVVGFAGLNFLAIIAAIIMKKKWQGV